jgi:putative nucleotidyltransferase-like protein
VKTFALQGETLVSVLLDPPRTLELGLRDWNNLLVQARRTFMLARLGIRLRECRLFDGAPAKARDQMRAASIAAESTQTAVRFEINRVRRALAQLEVPIILLKGAAYLIADLPPARGRFVGDLDLLVPRDKIDDVERTLLANGWAMSDLDPYDEHYYREWAHEIPPLVHPDRDTPLDIHHTIAPLTSRVHPDAAALIGSSLPLAQSPFRILAPADMVLHSAVHLFNDEVSKPLRDLFDLHDLLCHFSAEQGFWIELLARARLHGLGRPMHYMLCCTRRLLGTPIPDEIFEAANEWAPSYAMQKLMDALFAQYFLPELPDRPRRRAAIARELLYVRAHWLRMPPLMLARHLTIKAWRRAQERFARKPKERDVLVPR